MSPAMMTASYSIPDGAVKLANSRFKLDRAGELWRARPYDRDVAHRRRQARRCAAA